MALLLGGIVVVAQAFVNVVAALLLYARGRGVRAGVFVAAGFFAPMLVVGLWMSMVGGPVVMVPVALALVGYTAFCTWLTEPAGLPWATSITTMGALTATLVGLFGGLAMGTSLDDVALGLFIVAMLGGSAWCLLAPGLLGIVRGLADRQRRQAEEF